MTDESTLEVRPHDGIALGLIPDAGVGGRLVSFITSVAIQGVSLTVAGLDAAGFEVALVPETLERTNLADLRQGDRVNVEVDLLARYLERLLAGRGAAPPHAESGQRGEHG